MSAPNRPAGIAVRSAVAVGENRNESWPVPTQRADGQDRGSDRSGLETVEADSRRFEIKVA